MAEPTLQQMTFRVPQMDCSAEEQLVRLQLADTENVRHLGFDLDARTVTVVHSGIDPGIGAEIESLMRDLNLGALLVGTREISFAETSGDDAQQRSVLIIVLLINAALFVLELTVGIFAQSMGLVADSLDMLADAIVYGLSLFAVGRAVAQKKRVARTSGYFQLLLAVFGLFEVLRRFLGAGEEPQFVLMIVISLVALAGNVASLLVLQRARNQEVHMQASRIFTTNDVLVNIGVIVAGVLVYFTGSKVPDLVVGTVIFCLVGYGAFRILRLAR